MLLTGQLTRLADIISAEKKTYEAWVEFGTETDTLDPEGEPVLIAPLSSYKNLTESIPSFLGKILQRPPEFSAIKINGKRASDRIRRGEKIEIAEREIEIFKIDIKRIITDGGLEFTKKDFLNINTELKIKYAHIRVECSKGTYIRSLVRDLARKASSCAYVRALRRTAVGNFKLEDAAGFSFLNDFSTAPENLFLKETKTLDAAAGKKFYEQKEIAPLEIRAKAFSFSPKAAENLKLPYLFLDGKYLNDFYNGKKIKFSWFLNADEVLENITASNLENKKICVFCDNLWIGIIGLNKNCLKYKTVIKN